MKKITNIIFNNFYFCLFYLFSSLCFVTILKEIPHINLLSKIYLLWGALLVLVNTIKIFKRVPNLMEISIFIFLGFTLIINLLFHRSMGNLTPWIVNCIMLLGVFFIDTEKTPKELTKELNIISTFIVVFTFIFSVLYIILLASNTTFVLNDTTYGIGKDLGGLYVYNNALSIAAGISFLLSMLLLIINKNSPIKIKLFYRVNIIIQIFSLVFSQGRSAYFLLLAIPFVYFYTWIKNKFVRYALVIVPTIGAISIFALWHDKLYSFLSSRNELWYSAWLVIKQNFLFGVGNESLVSKVQEARPDVVLPGIEAGGLHNIFLQMTTANGILTLILFIFILFFTLSYLIKQVDKSYGFYKKIDLILLSLIVGILFINLFESNLIYIVSYISIIFWTYLSYFISIKKNNKI